MNKSLADLGHSPLNKALAEFVNTITTGLQIVGVVVLVLGLLYVFSDRHDGGCDAPCTVTFPSGTQEDDFKIDWRDGKLHVSTRPEGHK